MGFISSTFNHPEQVRRTSFAAAGYGSSGAYGHGKASDDSSAAKLVRAGADRTVNPSSWVAGGWGPFAGNPDLATVVEAGMALIALGTDEQLSALRRAGSD